MQPEERIIAIGADIASARLSVLTPFHKHDPSTLLAALGKAPAGVEFILVDDGSKSATLIANVLTAAERLNAPVRVIIWEKNQGRSAARNRLVTEARGEYVLFLDADMIPDSPRFLANWLGVFATQHPQVAFGGLSLKHAKRSAETALHHNVFARSDCHSAHIRARAPAQATASANLAVRRDFLAAHPFDANYKGWGFEDTDWALSASRFAAILHVENPASHAGLDDVATLMRKSAEAGANFARLARKHPDTVRRFAAYRTAAVLKRAPTTLRSVFAQLTRTELAPMPVRRAAFKLFRASHYAEHMA